MRIERARQLLDAVADQPSSNQALQLEVMIRDTTKVTLAALVIAADTCIAARPSKHVEQDGNSRSIVIAKGQS